ncbi:hypothetical protein HMI54_008603 [Coelomomyces lativittatus]|nr:hypothetical protein HMI56_005030 [Coelomomyces lativittatus]KAJ1518286.1 hypothetical protein HMI55_000260 [Coelomomyces lativittatus]KAJ1518746.1 hypothetical protein HMI54_008603 [Coelomomyces lativittatus]
MDEKQTTSPPRLDSNHVDPLALLETPPLHPHDPSSTFLSQEKKKETSPSSPSGYEPFEDQVAGHQLIIKLDDTKIGKPFTSIEHRFYLDVSHHYPHLLTYLPTHYPTHPLTLSHTYLVLKNVVASCQPPPASILDLKLGTQLYRDDASERKKQKMMHRANTTTNGTLGVRVSGMRVWNPFTRQWTLYPREYGYTLTQDTFHTCFLTWTQGVGGVPPSSSSVRRRRPCRRVLLLRRCLARVQAFAQCVQHVPGRFIGTSFLFILPSSSSLSTSTLGSEEEEEEEEEALVQVHWIDFVRSEVYVASSSVTPPDHQFMKGVESVMVSLNKAIQVLEEEQDQEK